MLLCVVVCGCVLLCVAVCCCVLLCIAVSCCALVCLGPFGGIPFSRRTGEKRKKGKIEEQDYTVGLCWFGCHES